MFLNLNWLIKYVRYGSTSPSDIWGSTNPQLPINTEREGKKERNKNQETSFIAYASVAINVCDFTKTILKHIK